MRLFKASQILFPRPRLSINKNLQSGFLGQCKLLHNYVECNSKEVQFLKEFIKEINENPESGINMLVEAFPQMRINILREIPQCEIKDKNVKREMVFRILNEHLINNYFGSFMITKSGRIMTLVAKDLAAFIEFVQRDPQNESFYIVCMANLMSENNHSYIKERPEYQPTKQLIIYIAKLRQKDLPPQTKVHLCRIMHLLKLEYRDYLDFVEDLEMDITTHQGFLAFQGIISLHHSNGIVSERVMRKWLRQFIDNFDKFDFLMTYRANDKLFNLIKANSCLEEIKIVADLMLEVIKTGRTEGHPEYLLRGLKFASILKYKLNQFQEDSLKHLAEYTWMINDNQNKKLVLNVFKANNYIPVEIMDACVRNTENKFKNFIQGERITHKDKVIIFREVTFIVKLFEKIDKSYYASIIKYLIQIGKKSADIGQFGTGLLVLRALENFKQKESIEQLIEIIDINMNSEFAGHWIGIYEFLHRNHMEYNLKYNIFQLNFKEYFKKNFDVYSEMYFFYEVTCFFLRFAKNPNRPKIAQFYHEEIEIYLVSFISNGNYTGMYLLKYLECMKEYSPKYPKLSKLIEENFIALIYDGRPIDKRSIQEIIIIYEQLENHSKFFVKLLGKILTNFQRRKIMTKVYVKSYHPNMKVRRALQWFIFRVKGRAFYQKEDQEFH